MANEIIYEALWGALEATRGTAAAAPTRNLGVKALLTPNEELSMPELARGMYAKYQMSNSVRRWAEWETDETDIDLNAMPFILSMFLRGGLTPVAQAAPNAAVQRWTFTPQMDTDDLRSATFWWGDPTSVMWSSAFCLGTELKIEAKGDGTDGVQFAMEGFGSFPIRLPSVPTAPVLTSLIGVVPNRMKAWLEPNATNPHGTTDITSRIVNVEWQIPTGFKPKFGPGGNGADPLTFRRVGRDYRNAECTIEMEVLDAAQFDAFVARQGQPVRFRSRFETPSPIVPGGTAPNGLGYLQLDITGPMTDVDWGDLESVNRTIKFTIPSVFDAGIACDYRAEVQCLSTTP